MSPLITWLVVSWAAGWFLLPLSRQLFSRLPDGGLAAGRVLWLFGVGILSLWLGVFHILPLSLAPLWVFGIPLLGLIPLAKPKGRADFSAWVRQQNLSLKWSDGVFIVGFLCFAWIRARNPQVSDLEKPMDAALLSAAARAHALPFPNPWFAETPFTDYYYSFHLIGGMLLRSFHTPVAVGYNLVHPLICALFLSTLWSLCAALSGTALRGLACMSIVALMGHFEPIREWMGRSTVANPDRIKWIFHLDWWSTSRVIANGNTINEYPAFTVGIGDAHAHFLAFPFAILLFALCHELSGAPLGGTLKTLTQRRILLLLCGALLALFWTGNTWDVPVYGLLVLACAAWPLVRFRARSLVPAAQTEAQTASPADVVSEAEDSAATRREKRRRERAATKAAKVDASEDKPLSPVTPTPTSSLPTLVGTLDQFKDGLEWAWAVLPLLLAYVVAYPYRKTFHAQISGLRFAPWLPPPIDVILFWGGFMMLLGVCWVFQTRIRHWIASSSTGSFAWVLFCCGSVAWLFPWLMYIRGAFGDGDLSHQDTVFKFGLQAWLMLGTVLSCSVARLLDAAPVRSRPIFAGAWATLWIVPLLCGWNIFWTRTSREDVPRDAQNRILLSLNSAKNISQDDQDAIEWLRQNAPPNAVVVEAVNPDRDESGGLKTGDFEGDLGRVSALSGVPAVLGWAQHTNSWGADGNKTTERHQQIIQIYQCPSPTLALSLLHAMHATYVFVGATERARYSPESLNRLSKALPDKVFQSGDTFIAQVPLQFHKH